MGEVEEKLEDLETTRVVRVCGEITYELGSRVIGKLLTLDTEAISPIKIMVISPGGDEPVAWAIVDTIKWLRSPVYTYSLGTSGSAGALIYLAGTKRFIFPHSTILLHSGFEDEIKNATPNYLKQFATQYVRENEIMLTYITEQTGRSLEEVREKIDHKEAYFLASEAVEFGIAHEMVPLKRPAALAKSARRSDVQTS